MAVLVGKKAPAFTAPAVVHGGDFVEDFSLDQFIGKKYVLFYFYPADFSPVCTAEACAFRDTFAGVSSVGAQIVGVSPQGVESHRRFSNSFSIPFPLLSDRRKKVIRAYGVDGPLGFGVRRATFLINQDGSIQDAVLADFNIGRHKEFIENAVKLR